MADVTKEQVKEFLSKMNVVEMSAFVKELEDAWGVKAAAPVAMAAAAGPAAAAAEAPKAEEPTEFNVILSGFAADKKLNVIKEVRTITGLGLKEAKDLVEGAPKPIKENVSKQEAADIKAKMEAAGAQVDVKAAG
jgi:large subunit ribosomal protein L7/L12